MATTLADYTASSNRRIQTKDAALTVAIEMLEKISNGGSYDSLEFLSLVARMKEIRATAVVARSCAHSSDPISDPSKRTPFNYCGSCAGWFAPVARMNEIQAKDSPTAAPTADQITAYKQGRAKESVDPIGDAYHYGWSDRHNAKGIL